MLQTYRQTELLLEVLADLKKVQLNLECLYAMIIFFFQIINFLKSKSLVLEMVCSKTLRARTLQFSYNVASNETSKVSSFTPPLCPLVFDLVTPHYNSSSMCLTWWPWLRGLAWCGQWRGETRQARGAGASTQPGQ